MKIRRINLPASELTKLPTPDRNLFFLVGHVNNEISSLTKIFSWCLAEAHLPGVAEVELNAANAQGMMYARILAGKLLEAWGALGRSWFASTLGAEISKTLHPAAADSLENLKVYFGSKNLIYAVRNSFAFHYDAGALGEHWERAAAEPVFELIIGMNRGNSFHQAAELVANVAVFHTIAPGNAQAGMAAFFQELDYVSEQFRNFCEGVTRAILERLSGTNLDHLGGLSDISPSRGSSEVTIPVFCRIEEEVEGVLP
jgi:hypothetical protein